MLTVVEYLTFYGSSGCLSCKTKVRVQMVPYTPVGGLNEKSIDDLLVLLLN